VINEVRWGSQTTWLETSSGGERDIQSFFSGGACFARFRQKG